MELTKRQFDVLVAIEANKKEKYSQRDIANDTNISVGLVNKIISELYEIFINKVVKEKINGYTLCSLKDKELLQLVNNGYNDYYTLDKYIKLFFDEYCKYIYIYI